MIHIYRYILCVAALVLTVGCEKKVVNNAGNNNPEIVSLTTTSAKLGLGQPAIIKCQATDPDGDMLSYVWESSDGGPLDAVSAGGNEVVYTTHTCCGGITEIMVTVNDTKGGNAKKGLLIEFADTIPVGE
jgi:hypothetical protein